MDETRSRGNPFPGLRPFRTEEHHLFFGREDQTAALLALLGEQRFLAVVGTSGSGKSSLVRAGLIPALHRGTMARAGSTWEVVILRPGGNPITSLARALLDADLYDSGDPEALPRLRAASPCPRVSPSPRPGVPCPDAHHQRHIGKVSTTGERII